MYNLFFRYKPHKNLKTFLIANYDFNEKEKSKKAFNHNILNFIIIYKPKICVSTNRFLIETVAISQNGYILYFEIKIPWLNFYRRSDLSNS